MYNINELRKNLKQALDRAKISPVKVLNGKKQVYYIISEEQFKVLQVKAISKVDVQLQRSTSVQEPEYIPDFQ